MWDEHTWYEVKPYDVKNDKTKTNFMFWTPLPSPPFSPPLKNNNKNKKKPPSFVECEEIERMKLPRLYITGHVSLLRTTCQCLKKNQFNKNYVPQT